MQLVVQVGGIYTVPCCGWKEEEILFVPIADIFSHAKMGVGGIDSMVSHGHFTILQVISRV